MTTTLMNQASPMKSKGGWVEQATDRVEVSVLMMARDSADDLRICSLPSLEAVERESPHIDFRYFFFENDSQDETAAVMEKWLRSRKGYSLSESFGRQKWGHEGPGPRMKDMAFYRQTLLDFAKSKGAMNSEYLFLVDSDISFQPDTINRYLETFSSLPDAVMLTPYCEHNIECHMCEQITGEKCGNLAYYDTLAAEDMEGNRAMVYSCNPWWSGDDREDWDKGKPVKVKTAYNGAALVKTDAAIGAEYLPCPGYIDHERFIRKVGESGSIYALPFIKCYSDLENPVLPADVFLDHQMRYYRDSKSLTARRLREVRW